MSMILQGHSYFTTIHKLSKTLYRDRSGHAGGSGGDIESGVGAVRGAADDIADNRRRSGWGGGAATGAIHKLSRACHDFTF
jgi:hypothetical protein